MVVAVHGSVSMNGEYSMNAMAHRFGAYSGFVFIGIFFVAMLIVVRFVPPLSPALGVEEINAIFSDESLQIRLASALLVYTCAFGWYWSATVATWTAKMEGGMPVLSVTQAICALFSFGGAYFTAVAWVSAAFRDDRPPQLVYLLSDQGWFWIVMMGSCAVMQMIFIGWCVLSDRSGDQLFPRWVGYANLWFGVLQIPGIVVAFFKEGPFAWDGMLAFWLPLTTFSLWIFVNSWALLQVVKRVENQHAVE